MVAPIFLALPTAAFLDHRDTYPRYILVHGPRWLHHGWSKMAAPGKPKKRPPWEKGAMIMVSLGSTGYLDTFAWLQPEGASQWPKLFNTNPWTEGQVDQIALSIPSQAAFETYIAFQAWGRFWLWLQALCSIPQCGGLHELGLIWPNCPKANPAFLNSCLVSYKTNVQ